MPYTKRLIALSAIALAACQPQPADPGGEPPDPSTYEPSSEAEKFSYAVGVDVARSLEQVSDKVDAAAFSAGFAAAHGSHDLAMTDEDMTAIKTTVSQSLQQAQQEEAQVAAKEATAKGEAFRTENAENDNVMVTDSGLQYEVLEDSDGDKPTAEDKVTVHYKGTLIDGTVFDSSYDRGNPATFPLSGVIPGWTEGLQLMPVGSKYRFVIPPELAYGQRGAGARIGPNETLVFEVELLSIGEPKES
ncbi:FKBP-type peptidyl-prolyl cis-trans isomerase [Abyssibacter sp.]|jgi:FKBP-type peptidyl-prolyl cis-trans isomerase|uniref:FKBP-type peptidyl-prolyl cis-trans isomerase n=1 Tax=Abyssibacter sp. TaxID=2320200 RepID=UPI0025BFF367|nr:FKBP-type peptidyl-prolyl cis-trans isomerase [Abyssibacter sp.]MCK5859367.1 FKBP-type peptidyl-prolyl cis-trans isomerase [Abyssibacter sp.]